VASRAFQVARVERALRVVQVGLAATLALRHRPARALQAVAGVLVRRVLQQHALERERGLRAPPRRQERLALVQ
jgi:hypothetical protein